MDLLFEAWHQIAYITTDSVMFLDWNAVGGKKVRYQSWCVSLTW